MSQSATTPPTSNTIQLAKPADQVLGVLPVDTGEVFVSLMYDDDGTAFFNLGFETSGDYVDLSLNPAVAYGLAAMICDTPVAVLTAPRRAIR